MWDAKRLLRCGERLYRAGKYALCALLIGLLVLLCWHSFHSCASGLSVAGDAMLTAAWIAALPHAPPACSARRCSCSALHLIALAKIAENTEKSP